MLHKALIQMIFYFINIKLRCKFLFLASRSSTSTGFQRIGLIRITSHVCSSNTAIIITEIHISTYFSLTEVYSVFFAASLFLFFKLHHMRMNTVSGFLISNDHLTLSKAALLQQLVEQPH